MSKLFYNEEVRALSWKQPYASLMLLGKIETRTWDTKYRGLVLICASKAPYSESQVLEISDWQGVRITEALNGADYYRSYPLGKAIAVGRLVDCRPMKREDEEKCYVKYRPDLFCHIYEDVRPIEPFEWKGSQGWKKLNQETINKIKFI